jgi:hypothetical protein
LVVYIGEVFKAIMLVPGTCDSHYVYGIELALATLGGVTEIGSFFISINVTPPKVAKASK